MRFVQHPSRFLLSRKPAAFTRTFLKKVLRNDLLADFRFFLKNLKLEIQVGIISPIDIETVMRFKR